MSSAASNQSVEKTLRIIEAMAAGGSLMRLADIAAAVNIPASTALRMLGTLIDMGYAYQDEQTRRYGLTLRFSHIGQRIMDSFPFYDVIHPYLTALAQRTRETCCAAGRRGYKIQYFDVITIHSAGALTIRQQAGGFAPAHCTGCGKVFLSSLAPRQLDELIAQEGLSSYTSRTITGRAALDAELALCRARGWAMDDEEVETGIRCLAAPVYDSVGRVAAALSISGPVSRMDMDRCENELVPLLLDTAGELTVKISGSAGQ